MGLTALVEPCNACTMTTTRSTRRPRLTTEWTRAENLGTGFRYLDTLRTERTVISATLIEAANPQDDTVIVTTATGSLTYRPWTMLAVYVIDGRPA